MFFLNPYEKSANIGALGKIIQVTSTSDGISNWSSLKSKSPPCRPQGVKPNLTMKISWIFPEIHLFHPFPVSPGWL